MIGFPLNNLRNALKHIGCVEGIQLATFDLKMELHVIYARWYLVVLLASTRINYVHTFLSLWQRIALLTNDNIT